MNRKNTKNKKKKQNNKGNYFDYSLLAILVLLVCFGLVMLYSTSSYSAMMTYGDSMYYLKRQMAFALLGFGVIALIVKFIPTWFYYKFAGALYVLALFLMLLVQSPLGVEVKGARRWLKIGVQFQPSEIAKIAIILFVPVVICKMGKSYREKKARIIVLAIGILAGFFAFKFTENLSTALIIVGISAIILFVSHPNMKSLVLLGFAGLTIVVASLIFISSNLSTSTNFRLRRILSWLRPEEYASDGSYQTVQGLYAIGSGGLFGKGLGASSQKMIIPEVQNDMILTVICEELGIFGALIVLVLFGYLLYRLFFIAQNAPNLYSSLVVVGIFAHIALQVVLNIGVVTGILPTTGVTLPFISYGGTSSIFLMTEMGIALGISKTIKLA